MFSFSDTHIYIFREKVSANSQVVTTILPCVQGLRAQEDAGPASGPLGPFAGGHRNPPSAPTGSEGHYQR